MRLLCSTSLMHRLLIFSGFIVLLLVVIDSTSAAATESQLAAPQSHRSAYPWQLKQQRVAEKQIQQFQQHKSYLRIFEQYSHLRAADHNVTVIADYGEKKLAALRFLHIPKTGTTLAATVVHYCCEQTDRLFVDVILPFSGKQAAASSTCVRRLCGCSCI